MEFTRTYNINRDDENESEAGVEFEIDEIEETQNHSFTVSGLKVQKAPEE